MQPTHNSMLRCTSAGILSPDDDVGHGESTARFQDPERLVQHGIFIAGEVDHAVRDNHVHGIGRQRNRLDGAFEEFDVSGTCLSLIGTRQIEHRISHVQTVGFPGRANSLCREQHINAAA